MLLKTTLRKLISDSNIHSGFRVLLAMAITFLPVSAYDYLPFFTQNSLHISVMLCLGVMASAIVETDENYKSRGKFIVTIALCFFIASISVELLMPYPILFTLGLFISSFLFMMLATLGSHYNKVGFGAILIAIYTMVGFQGENIWYEQPVLLTLGILWYGLFSIIWNFYNPYRSLREQLAQLFFTLSRYQLQKSALFNEQKGKSREGLFAVRQQLAIINISIMARLQQCQQIIQSRFQVCHQQTELQTLNQYYVIAEQIHERVSASQYLYSQLATIFGKSQILEGYHQLLLQLSEDCYQLGYAINDKTSYQHSRRLKWTINVLADQLYLLKQKSQLFNNNNEAMQALQAIYENINGINQLLLSISNNQAINSVVTDKQEKIRQPFWQPFFKAMNSTNPTFKHAIRISISLSLAFVLQHSLQLSHGFWILLTVLFVCQPSFSETRKRLIQRTLGTLIGILIGYPVLMLVNGTFMQVILLILSAFFFFNYLRTNYGLAVIFITLFVVFIFNLLTGAGTEILPYRIGETLIGCVLSILAISFIFPDWQFQRFPSLVNQLLIFSGRYFNQVSQQYQYGRSENLSYRNIRFKTFKSDAILTSAWQSMLFEPSSKQQLTKETYALVNRCDALVSYIAALASHRHKMVDFENNNELQNLINATSAQIYLAYNPDQNVTNELDTIDIFENYKANLSGEVLLIVEQLRLIAFTALDIQLLLQQVNCTTNQSQHQDNM